jgi:uncharacterized phage-associated protein
MSYPVKAIANYFIKKAQTEKDASLNLMKLLKLIYLAQGWCLALYDKSLINEAIQAWEYGPVVPEIYHEFKHRGMSPIDDIATDWRADEEGRIQVNKYEAEFDKDTKALLNRIGDVYRPNTGIQLSNWSHDEKGAWYKVWNKERGYNSRNRPIPNQYMKEYFNTLRNSDGKQYSN